jgi:hypothetical protein
MEMIRRSLERNGLLIVDGKVTHVVRSDDASFVLAVLVSGADEDECVEQLEAYFSERGHRGDHIDWRHLVASFVSREALTEHFASLASTNTRGGGTEDAESELATPLTTRTIRYGMTVVGMGLGVLGFGMLLQHRPHIRGVRGSVDGDGEGFQMLPIYIVLLVLFAAFDLACTMFANQGGGLMELNPIGNGFMDKPIALIGLKLSATMVSALILFQLRPYRIAQVTSWWLCLVCVMLTLRWVMFNSMFLT